MQIHRLIRTRRLHLYANQLYQRGKPPFADTFLNKSARILSVSICTSRMGPSLMYCCTHRNRTGRWLRTFPNPCRFLIPFAATEPVCANYKLKVVSNSSYLGLHARNFLDDGANGATFIFAATVTNNALVLAACILSTC